ncbi:MAG: hypothetical protein KGL45_06465 [Gammaproteobacteria bacterium]|nr:hypothetical protein [Gammaproteobacteria bacterium]
MARPPLDPNYGLFVYNGRDKMTLDLQRVMDERASSADKKATLRFFVKT